ncbi:Protein kinase alk2 [Mortierella hygrophila]|uniref:Protein kinase alk2 n=1 Tax=Mortierella hygrophila TaxID=979708 RepID=A0A9P6FBV8_9FUNG|nr:Protein kinase alk2 [Mortierella hygrophila]
MDSIANNLSRTKCASVWIVLGLLHNLTIYLTHHKRSLSRFLSAYTLLYIFRHRRTAIGVTPRKDLKTPGGSLPLVGDIVKMTFQPRTEVYQLNEKIHKEVGRVFAITLPFVGRVVDFTDPAVLEHVLKTNFWAYEKGEFLRRTFFDLLGNGIFNADGHSWNWQRKMASHIFNVNAFRHYTSEVFVKESYIVADYLGMIAEEERTVDIHKLFYLYTLDSFGEISFGQSFGCLDSPEEGTVEFAEAFDRLNTIVFNRVFTPGWQLTELLTSRGRQIRKDKQTIASFALKIIRDRRIHGYDKPQKDLLQLCMDMQDAEDGRRLSDEMLKDMVLNFIIAGRDTTAQALSWTFYLLFRSQTNPQVVQKLVEEVDGVLKGQSPTFDSCKNMKFAEACVYEALRLYPSVSGNMKVAVQDDVWPDGTRIYKGEFASWCSWTMGRDTTIWGPDAREYNPDRWMTGEKFPAHKFPAFHAGPRTCLGQQFATVEAITILAILLQRFTFELVDPDTEPEYIPGLTLPMANGLSLRVHQRPV